MYENKTLHYILFIAIVLSLIISGCVSAPPPQATPTPTETAVPTMPSTPTPTAALTIDKNSSKNPTASVQATESEIPENIYYPPIKVHPINEIVATVTIIETIKQDSKIGSASGFFYLKNDSLYLITNKHVVYQGNPEKLKLRLHKNPNDIQDNGDYIIELFYNNGSRMWLEHSISEIDVVAIPLNTNEISNRFFVKAISKSNFLPENLIIDIGEDVLVIGYPIGFYDTINNLPIYRDAMIASTYPVSFRGNPYFLIDAQLHPGTSGSPIFTKPKSAWKTKDGTAIIAGNPMYFLGVHSASLSFNNRGKDEALGLNTVWFGQLIEEIIP